MLFPGRRAATAASRTTAAATAAPASRGTGNEMNTYADDLAALVADELDLKDAVHVGHSTGGGEVARYIGRHGARARRPGGVDQPRYPPLMLKTPANPGGLADRSIRRRSAPGCCSGPARGYREGPQRAVLRRQPGRTPRCRRACATRSGCRACWPAIRPSTIASKPSPKPTSPKICKKFDVPTLVLHGDDDQIVPDRRCGSSIFKNRQRRHPEGNSRRPARHVLHSQRSDQRRVARFLPALRSGRGLNVALLGGLRVPKHSGPPDAFQFRIFAASPAIEYSPVRPAGIHARQWPSTPNR